MSTTIYDYDCGHEEFDSIQYSLLHKLTMAQEKPTTLKCMTFNLPELLLDDIQPTYKWMTYKLAELLLKMYHEQTQATLSSVFLLITMAW